MSEQTEENQQLEQELQTIWQNAANTRKATAPRRITAILDSSRAELSLRDLLTFFIYLGKAFFSLFLTALQALFTPHTPVKTPRSNTNDRAE